jgi:two-component system phosphate regulon sensor histidine kinase PhoR
VTLEKIAKNIEDYSPIESSYAFLIDRDGRAIALPAQGYQDLLGRASKDKEFGSDLKEVRGDFGAILANMRAGKSGFVSSAKAGGVNLYVAYEPVAGTPFSLGIVARQDAMLKVVADLQNQVAASIDDVIYSQLIPVGIVILLFVWMFGFAYIRRITEPIKLLTDKTAQVASGNFNVMPEAIQSDNEIGQLANSFNRMVTDLRESRHKIEEQNREMVHNEQARLKASINSLHVGFIMTGVHNEVVMLNGAAKEILSKDKERSWSADEIDQRLGKTVAFKDNLAKVLRTGKPVDKKEIDFENFVLRVFTSPILEGTKSGDVQKLGAVVLVENITEAKLLERSKDEFFSIASHELRTPLTAVRGNAAMLQSAYSAKVHETDFDEMVGDIHDASVRLIEIVNDFLDATRLEQGKIKFEGQAFNIHEVLKAVVYEMDTVARGKGISVKIADEVDSRPPIFADKNRVKQIVYNLVGNAMKFTEKGVITIDAKVEKNKLKVYVSDTGPGISAENQRLLFRKFQQAGNKFLTRDTRGTGLGLYISKLLCEQMGGRISLEESKLGVGTTFAVTLPLAKGDQL